MAQLGWLAVVWQESLREMVLDAITGAFASFALIRVALALLAAFSLSLHDRFWGPFRIEHLKGLAHGPNLAAMMFASTFFPLI